MAGAALLAVGLAAVVSPQPSLSGWPGAMQGGTMAGETAAALVAPTAAAGLVAPATPAAAAELVAAGDPAALAHAAAAGTLAGASEADELAASLAHIAQSRGWTIAQAEANHRSAEAVGAVAGYVAASAPEMFIGSALADDPTGAPTLYLKGAADAAVLDRVAKAGVPILVAQYQPFSFAELEQRKLAVHDALAAMGYRSIGTGYDFRSPHAIEASVVAQAGAPADAAAAQAKLPEALRADVRISIRNAPVGAGLKTAYGGNVVSSPYGYFCTSGFAVYSVGTASGAPLGTTGVSTAGHCPSTINEIQDVTTGQSHAYALKAGHEGAYGDITWGTTGSVIDSPRFRYSSSTTTVKAVTRVEPQSMISLNENVCTWGAASQGRHGPCSPVVNVSQRCTFEDGLARDRLVRVRDVLTDTGDSGGPWFIGTSAYGSTIGECSSFIGDMFGAADFWDEALSVRVRHVQTIGAGVRLVAGDKLVSTDGEFTAVMQSDGNFVLYWNGHGVLWSTGTNGNTGATITMQTDGNLVVRRADGTAIWTSGTSGSGHYLTMQTDGNLVMYGSGGAKWSSGTCCH